MLARKVFLSAIAAIHESTRRYNHEPRRFRKICLDSLEADTIIPFYRYILATVKLTCEIWRLYSSNITGL